MCLPLVSHHSVAAGIAGLRATATGLLLALLTQQPAWADALLNDFERARQFDPAYTAALAENEGGKLQAKLASMAYFPEGRVSASQLDNESAGRITASITQPILSYDRWLSLKEADPRLASAAARLEESQQDLAMRLFKAVSAMVDVREKIKLNETTSAAIESQTASARRLLELGQGTVTDVRDAEVRLAQNRSETFSLKALLASAERQYAAIVGYSPSAAAYALSSNRTSLNLPSLQEFMDRARSQNPGLRASQQATVLSEIGTRRANAALFPSLVATAQQSRAGDGVTTRNAGINLRMEIPLQAGSFYRNQTAALELQKAQQREREVRQRLELDVERLHIQLIALQSELAVRREGIRAAELSLEANEQSFKGGFRTRVDVLNAIKAVSQARADYTSALLRLGETLLSLQLTSAVDIDLALRQVQEQMFSR